MGQVIDGVHTVTITEFPSYLFSLPKNDIDTPYKFNITSGVWGNEQHVISLKEPLKSSGYFLDYSETEFSGTRNNFFELFKDCIYLVKSPKLPIGAEDMTRCFENCSALIEAPELPQGVLNLLGTFKYCTRIETTPYIPNSVYEMNGCFIGCSRLKHVTNISTRVGKLYKCFQDCTSLNEPFIIPSANYLKECFKGCTSLKIAPKIMPKTVYSFVSCFEDCVNLEYVSIITDFSFFSGAPNSFQNMFKNCPKLKGFYLHVPYEEKNEIAFYEIKTKASSGSEDITIYKNGSTLYTNTFQGVSKKTFAAKTYTLMASITKNEFEKFFTRVRRYLSNFINGFTEVPMLENAVIIGTKDKTNTFIKGVNLE